MMYVLNSPSFQYLYYQYLWSEFNKKSDKSVYFEALDHDPGLHIKLLLLNSKARLELCSR